MAVIVTKFKFFKSKSFFESSSLLLSCGRTTLYLLCIYIRDTERITDLFVEDFSTYFLFITNIISLLCYRKGNSNLLIKIHHRHGQYGFCADSCPFESVPSLVSYYQHHSLAEYNSKLNLKLRRGIAKPCQVCIYI